MSARYPMELARFFRVVPPVPRLMSGAMLVAATIGAALIAMEPARALRALTPVLLLQLFAASSGLAVPARRGHYDLLLTRRGDRLTVALMHWGFSVAPGVASWLGLGLAELVASQGSRATLLAWGTVAAMCTVSTLPWALNVALPRFAGAIGWLVVLVATVDPSLAGSRWRVASSRVEDVVWPAWTFLINPFSVVGEPLTQTEALAIAPGLLLAAGAMTVACVWVARADVPLEAAQ